MIGMELWALGLAVVITLLAGFVKGAVGFAMPLIMISALSAYLPPETALAGLILPTLVTNISQAFRQGWRAALGSVRAYGRLIVATVLFIVIAGQFVRDIPRPVFLLLLGVPVTGFALAQLTGRNLALKLEHRHRAEWVLGAIGGLYGGIAGVWGPPVLVYLLSIGADKREMVRVTGVIFLIGAVVLLVVHLQTGVMNARTQLFSALLVVPAMIGLAAGYRLQDRLPQEKFRRWTQALLVLTGLNLIRGGLGL